MMTTTDIEQQLETNQSKSGVLAILSPDQELDVVFTYCVFENSTQLSQ
jgi:hypothetical protein